MDASEPFAIVCPTLDGPVLTVLARTTRPLSAREVSRLVTRGSWAGVRRTLMRLTEQGIVRMQEAGNSTLFTLNRRHLGSAAVEQLIGLHAELMRRLSATFRSWQVPPLHGSLFGSMARGDGDTASDVDLFVVRPRVVPADEPAWSHQLDGLAADVLDWTGNHAGVVEVEENKLSEVPQAVAQAIIRDGITLFGPEPSELLGGAR